MPRRRTRQTVLVTLSPGVVVEALPDGLHRCPSCGEWSPPQGVDPPLKQCPWCEVWFGPRLGEQRQRQRWAGRVYCSPGCQLAAARRRREDANGRG